MVRYLCEVVTQELSHKIQILLAHLRQKYITHNQNFTQCH